MTAPCLTCAHATPVEAERITAASRAAELVLRCDWAPDAEQPRWFAAGMTLCNLADPAPCDAWRKRGIDS